MIDEEKARAIAVAYLETLPVRRRCELAIQDEHTREEDFGWVFFYNSKAFIETGDTAFGLGGNGPLIVDRVTGEVVMTGTAFPVAHYIEYYRLHRTMAGVHGRRS